MNRKILVLITSLWLACSLALQADDIDVYLDPGLGSPGAGCGLPAGLSLVAPSYADIGIGLALHPDDMFFSLFGVDPGALWPGNVKKLKLVELVQPGPQSVAPATRTMVAQAPLSAPPKTALAGDGGILSDALTFWTDPAGRDVRGYNPLLGEVSGTDGRSVKRGGAGQQLPGYLAGPVKAANSEPGARQLYTLDPGNPGQLIALDASVPLPQLATYLDPDKKMTAQQEQHLVAWIRGQDAYDEDADGDLLEPRRWLLGAVLHSRPLVVNYGARPGTSHTLEKPDIRVFFGSNDGIFHSLRNTGGTSSTIAPDSESGAETWAFIPPSLLAVQSRLAANQAATPLRPEYGMDGEAVALETDFNHDGTIDPAAGDSIWVYIGQRRGGRNVYAFDMSDPDKPQFKWQISNKVPGFERLALTFSTPRAAMLDLVGVGPVRALLFAGGYNGGWNGAVRIGKDAGAADDEIGNAIYVVNADTGELLWQAVGPGALQPQPANGSPVLSVPGLRDSIPSALSVVDADDNGSIDRAYVGDSGGNVWRIDLSGGGNGPGQAATDPALWSVSQVASLGGNGSSDRRFFHAPDFVRSRDERGNYDGIVIATGDRAAPARNSALNYLFLLKDRATVPASGKLNSTPAVTVQDLPDISLACDGSDELACAALDLGPGWRLALQAPGEKALSSPLVSNGRILFTSYLPALKAQLGSCADRLGWGRVYAVKLRNGGVDAGMAGLLSPLGQTTRYTRLGVGIPGEVLPYREQVLLPGPAYAGHTLLRLPGPGRWRAYWREEDVDFP